MKEVLVTGGTSFIGKHCIVELLKENYVVRTTLRDISRSNQITSDIEEYLGKKINLKFYEADLTKDTGWDEAIIGCDAIFHVAGPFPISYDGEENDLIFPHEKGTLRVLENCVKHSVKRVVMTSSVASVFMTKNLNTKINESCWTDISNKDLDAYTKSKTLAEMAAWDFVSKNDSIKLTTILPPVVLGPGIGKLLKRGSLEFFSMMINREMPVAPPFKMGIVDVRDVAKMHVAALKDDKAIGKRFIVCENTYWVKDFCKMLNEIGHKAPTMSPPVFLVKFLANFDKTIKPIKKLLGLDIKIDSSQAKELLKYDPIPIGKTLKDTSNYFKINS
tara:strand:+ start:2329 stop:3324 length:996 start_codon:yes stop_codon:yes gene_type:complete